MVAASFVIAAAIPIFYKSCIATKFTERGKQYEKKQKDNDCRISITGNFFLCAYVSVSGFENYNNVFL